MTDPTTPDAETLQRAREAAAQQFEADRQPSTAQAIRVGLCDSGSVVQSALRAIALDRAAQSSARETAAPVDGGEDDEVRIAINTDAEQRLLMLERALPFEISKHLSTVSAHVIGIYDACPDPLVRMIAACMKSSAVDAGEAFVAALDRAAQSAREDDDVHRCFACQKPFKAGELVMPEVNEGLIHVACCGPEPESYVGADGETLKPGDLLPVGYPYEPPPVARETAAPVDGGHYGWLYHNPDTGEEWSENHPIESGEVEDAERVRPATAQALHEELISVWSQLEDARAELYAAHPAQAPIPETPVLGDSSDVALADLRELLTVLGMGDHARPQSPHEVFQEALGVLRERLSLGTNGSLPAIEWHGKDRKGVSVVFARSEFDSEAHHYEEVLPGMVVALDGDGSILSVDIEDLKADMSPPNEAIPETHVLGERWADDPLIAYLERQWSWSKETFGPALRTRGIIQHITKELREIADDPHDLAEWVDVIILAMDGFWRHGGKPESLLPAMQAKQDRNFARTWPDWRTMGEDQAIEHDRSGEAAPAPDQTPPRGGVTVEALEDCRTHRSAWRTALQEALAVAPVIEPDIDDASYWRNEIEVFDRTFDVLTTLSRQSAGAGTERVRHVKRGTEYEVLHRGVELQISTEYPGGAYDQTTDPRLYEGTNLVIYQGTDGKLWARDEDEFADGRFVPAPPETPPAGTPQGETGGPV